MSAEFADAPSREEEEEGSGLLRVLPETILCSLLLWVVRNARTYGPRGRRLLLETSHETISDGRILSCPWEEFRSASSGRVFVGMARWSTGWRERWTSLLPDLAKALRLSGDYVGGLSVAASALWASRVVLDDSKRAALFAEIAACRLAAHARSGDAKPARFALRDACRSVQIDDACAAGHAARGGALVTFGRHTDAATAFRRALEDDDASSGGAAAASRASSRDEVFVNREDDDDDDEATVANHNASSPSSSSTLTSEDETERVHTHVMSEMERAAAREALATALERAKEARLVELELCVAESGNRARCSIRSDAPLRQLLANERLREDTTALFVVTDDLEIPSDFWHAGHRKAPSLRSVRYLDPDSTPDNAAFQPGNVASLAPGTRVFCGWPNSNTLLDSVVSSSSSRTSPPHAPEAPDDTLADQSPVTASTRVVVPPPR